MQPACGGGGKAEDRDQRSEVRFRHRMERRCTRQHTSAVRTDGSPARWRAEDAKEWASRHCRLPSEVASKTASKTSSARLETNNGRQLGRMGGVGGEGRRRGWRGSARGLGLLDNCLFLSLPSPSLARISCTLPHIASQGKPGQARTSQDRPGQAILAVSEASTVLPRLLWCSPSTLSCWLRRRRDGKYPAVSTAAISRPDPSRPYPSPSQTVVRDCQSWPCSISSQPQS